MRIKQLMTLGTLGVFLLAGAAFGQNIQTNTTSTTLGSPTFGFVITPTELGRVMQATTAPTCSGPNDNRICTLDNYVKAVGMPGSFTGNPNKIVWTTADFGCGFLCGTQGGSDPQTAPDFAGPNTLTGIISSNIDLGLGTVATDPFHSAGHITFTLNPAALTNNATIDQQIVQNINNATGLTMSFTETDVTPTPFTSTPSSGNPILVATDFAGPVNLTASLQLTQTGDSGLPTATPFTLNVSVPFPYAQEWNSFPAPGGSSFTGSNFPPENAFATPGLNVSTGTPNSFPDF